MVLSFAYGSKLEIVWKTHAKRDGSCLEALSIPFSHREVEMGFPLPKIEKELSVSILRRRPDAANVLDDTFSLRLKRSGQSRKCRLPCRIGLRFDGELKFSDENSPFWLELSSAGPYQISARSFVSNASCDRIEAESFALTVEDPPLKSAHEFTGSSPLKLLADARFLGKDLFLGKYGEKEGWQRLEFGPPDTGSLQLQEGDLLSWQEGRWTKITDVDGAKGCLFAKVFGADDKSIFFEAWDLDEYMRFSVSSCPPPPLKVKADEFLTAVRVRSEKQISCMLDKHCFVLRAGDWILKEETRWHVLRSALEKEAYLQGKLAGEMFVFDRIDMKGGQKVVLGNLFNANRSQIVPIEIAAHPQGKGGQPKEAPPQNPRKGKGK